MREYEVHTHTYISGPKARWGPASSFEHSHEAGSDPHQHPDTGPAAYTIDKDEWATATGLTGGGRRKFTPDPSGLQLEREELEEWQGTFRVVVGKSAQGVATADEGSAGGAQATTARMVMGFRMRPIWPAEEE